MNKKCYQDLALLIKYNSLKILLPVSNPLDITEKSTSCFYKIKNFVECDLTNKLKKLKKVFIYLF